MFVTKSNEKCQLVCRENEEIYFKRKTVNVDAKKEKMKIVKTEKVLNVIEQLICHDL